MVGVKNNATSKILGFEYQKLIALEMCLNAKKNETIYIECFGDVSDGKTSIESKYHEKSSPLSDRSPDLWKTLYNLVDEREVLKFHERFELHTTSLINEKSVCYNWNLLSPDDKYLKLKGVGSNSTIKHFFDYLFFSEIQEEVVKSILSKVFISSSLPNFEEKIKSLIEHVALCTIREPKRKFFLEKMIGYITAKAGENPKQWSIYKNDFDRDLQYYAGLFSQDELPFPKVEDDKVIVPSNSGDFLFVKEMNEIGFRKSDISKAINYHLKAELSRLEMLAMLPAEPIDDFDDELQEDMNDAKSKHLDFLQLEDIDTPISKDRSKLLYRSCLEINRMSIVGVRNIPAYYYKGRVHSCIQPKSFSLIFCEDDL